ncbi:hypothetical protein OAW24_00795 [bacterium]|nr:hypothetical protein [bacterium]
MKKGDNMNILNYKSPSNEHSVYKGIPMEYRNHPLIQKIMMSRLFSIKYRGKSKVGYIRPQNGCHKHGADTFAIYPYSNYSEYKKIRMEFFDSYGYGDCWKRLHSYFTGVADTLSKT